MEHSHETPGDETHLPLPHEYTVWDATRETLAAHKFLISCGVILVGGLIFAASRGMMNAVLPTAFGVMTPTCFAFAVFSRRASVRRARHLALAERVGERSLIERDDTAQLGIRDRVGVRIAATLRGNMHRVFGCAAFVVGVSVLWGLVAKSMFEAVVVGGVFSVVIVMAMFWLLLRDVLRPDDDIAREVRAVEGVKIRQRNQSKELAGGLTEARGGADDLEGALTRVAEGGALTPAETEHHD